MPKELTHWILADRALDGLDADSHLRSVILAQRALFLGGAVLPDTLLHLYRGPNARTALSLGHRFHDSRDNSYAPLIQAEANYPEGCPDALLACLLGVLCHMQADIVFHPYVYAVGGTKDIGRHYRLETAIDVHFLHNGAIPPVRRFSELLTPQTHAVLVDTIRILFDPQNELPPQALDQAVMLHCQLQGLYGRPGWKIAARILGSLFGSPFKEQRHLFYPLNRSASPFPEIIETVREWNHPVTGLASQASVNDLADETVQRTVALFRRIELHGTLAAALTSLPGANLLTGLVGTGKADMR